MNRFLVWLFLISVALSRWLNAESRFSHDTPDTQIGSDREPVALATPVDAKWVSVTSPSTHPATSTGSNRDVSRFVLQQVRSRFEDLTDLVRLLTEVADEVRQSADPYSIPITRLQSAVRVIEQIHQLQRMIEDDLVGLVADDVEASVIKHRFEEIKSVVVDSEKVVLPVYDKLIEALDPKRYPTLGDDTKRLNDFVSMYSDARILQKDPARSVILLSEIAQATREHDRILKDYDLLIRQNTDLGKRLTSLSTDFQKNRIDFLEAAQRQKQILPGEIDSDLAQVTRLSEQALQEHQPLLFLQDIPQRMEQISDKLLLLQSLDSEPVQALRKRIERVRADLTIKQQTLSQGIIDSNPLPTDSYSGTDRKKIEQLAIEAWQKEQPDAQILSIRIPSNTWKRETLWRFQNTWYFIDRSRLQVQLVIKHNDKLAVIRPINFWIDHTSHDEYKAFPMDGINDNLDPQRFIRLEKLESVDIPSATRSVTSVLP
ncbi:MAG: hypothetical protein KatS3mg104_2231 [Phycisphaerae bacterium]|jgi:hypothetical protein|nr:MAG: hypothetical protein KatS3mg104_2231 [Phycisphaerae bacterium]